MSAHPYRIEQGQFSGTGVSLGTVYAILRARDGDTPEIVAVFSTAADASAFYLELARAWKKSPSRARLAQFQAAPGLIASERYEPDARELPSSPYPKCPHCSEIIVYGRTHTCKL